MRQTNLEANHIGLGVPINFRLRTALLTEGEANVELRGRIGPIPDQGQIDWQRIPLQISLKTTALPLAPVTPYLGAQPPLTAGELGTDITIEGSLSDALSVKGKVALDKAIMPAANGQGQPTALPRVALAQDLTLNLAKSLLTIANAQADLGALQATVTGRVKQFDQPAPQLDLRLKTSTFVIDEALKQWPMLAKTLPPTLSAQSAARGKIALQATVQGVPDRLRLTSQLDAQDLSIRPDGGEPLAFAKLKFRQDAKIDMVESRLDLTQANLDVGVLQAAMKGTITNFNAAPQLKLRLKTTTFVIDDALKQWPMLAKALPPSLAAPGAARGKIALQATVEGALDRLRLISQLDAQDLSIRPDGGEPLAFAKLKFRQDAKIDMVESRLDLTQANLDVGLLQAAMKGTIANFKAAPQLNLRLKTTTFVIDEALKQWPMLAKALPPTLIAQGAPQGKIALQATVQGALDRLRLVSQLDAQNLSIRPSGGAPLAFSKVKFRQDAKIDMVKSRLDLTQANLDVGFLQAAIQGTIINFNTAPQLSFRLKTAKFDPAKVISHLPMLADALPQPAAVEGGLQLQATLQGTPDNLKTDTRITAPALSLKSGSFHGGAAAKGGMRMDLAGLQTHVQGTYRQGDVPAAKVAIKAKRLVFDQRPASAQAAPAAGGKPGGKPAAKPPAAAKAPPINARGNVAVAEGSISGMAFRNLKAAFSIINGILKSQQTVQMFDGAYSGALTANLTQAKPTYQLNMKLANMQAGQVANAFASTPNLVLGRLNTDVKLSGKGMEWRDISTTLTGNGNIDVANFKLTTLDIMPKIAKGLSAASAIGGFTVPKDLATRSFDKLKASMRVQDGKIRSDDLKMWGPDVQVLGKGLFGLDQSLTFDGVAMLLGKLAQSLGKRADFLRDKDGRVNIPLAIRGSMTRPRVALDEKRLTDLAQRALTQRLQQQAGQKANKLLEKVLPGAKTGGEPGQRPDPAPDPVKEINKAVKGLFKR